MISLMYVCMETPNAYEADETECDALTTKKELFVAAYLKSLCNASEACREVGISRQTFYRWQQNDPSFRERIEEAVEQKIDWYERKAHELVQRGDTTMTIFLLKTQGRRRGYDSRYDEPLPPSADISQILQDIQGMSSQELMQEIRRVIDKP